jgi:hypothetical protein
MAMGGRIHKVIVAVLLAAAAPAYAASWQDEASDQDIARLAQLPEIRAEAVLAAHAGKGEGDERILDRVMAAQGRNVSAKALAGNWRCRQIKLGRAQPYRVFGVFPCRIRATGEGLMLEKPRGSQRFAGLLYPGKDGWVYLGASSAGDEPVHEYSGRTPSLGASGTPDDQIGLLTSIGANHLRLEIPATQESLLDVVEFTK